eukprot:EG_transcript_24825
MPITYDPVEATHPLLEVRQCAAGRGWFAARPIEAGAVLFSRRPLATGDSLEDIASKIDAAAAPYNGLCRPEGAPAAHGIAERNCFRSVAGRWLLYGPDISLINHACCPSASVVWGPQGCAHVVAICTLQPGDELTFCYSSALLFSPLQKRRQELAERWGFTCGCERCGGPMEAAEASMWEALEAGQAEVTANTPRRLAINEGLVALLKDVLAALRVRRPWLCEALDLHDALRYFAEDWRAAGDGVGAGVLRPALD